MGETVRNGGFDAQLDWIKNYIWNCEAPRGLVLTSTEEKTHLECGQCQLMDISS